MNSGRPAPRNRATKWTARLGLAGVSAIAAVVSYFHALAVVQHAGARPPVAYLVPFLADLVILAASAALLDATRTGNDRPRLATLALAAGIGVTLAMNIAAGWAHGLAGALVAGWPAAAFILALESLAGILRRGRGGAFPAVYGAAPATWDQGEPPSTDEALRVLLATGSQRKLAESLGVPRSRVGAWAARVVPVAGDVPAGVLADPPPPPAGALPLVAPGAGAAANGQAGHG
jgi:Protein of unknown function (DUF2637)